LAFVGFLVGLLVVGVVRVVVGVVRVVVRVVRVVVGVVRVVVGVVVGVIVIQRIIVGYILRTFGVFLIGFLSLSFPVSSIHILSLYTH
jgi:nuclear receptor subfamily 6 group A